MKPLFLLTAIASSFVLCSCSKPAKPAIPLTPIESQALTNSFAHLEKVLANKSPAIQTNLASPASDADISTLRTALDGQKVEVLEAWFRWHNGALNLKQSLLPLGRPLSIAEALEDRKLTRSIPFMNKLRKNSVKIMDDGAGDGFFLDVTAAKPAVFYQMLEDPSPQSYGTMTEFVNFIANGFETGVFFVNPAGEFDYDKEKYNALEASHFKSIGK